MIKEFYHTFLYTCVEFLVLYAGIHLTPFISPHATSVSYAVTQAENRWILKIIGDIILLIYKDKFNHTTCINFFSVDLLLKADFDK